jgi:hypothetical protein
LGKGFDTGGAKKPYNLETASGLWIVRKTAIFDPGRSRVLQRRAVRAAAPHRPRSRPDRDIPPAATQARPPQRNRLDWNRLPGAGSAYDRGFRWPQRAHLSQTRPDGAIAARYCRPMFTGVKPENAKTGVRLAQCRCRQAGQRLRTRRKRVCRHI